MSFLEHVPAQSASEETRRMYERQAGFFGYLPNYATVFARRPEIMTLWAHLQAGIKAHMPRCRYELITLVAAHELRSTYCCLAHSKNLLETFSADEIRRILVDDGASVLSTSEMAVVRHARLVARHADRVSADDVGRLRAAGFDDGEIFDITAAAAARAFFTKLVDGLGAEADAAYAELDPVLLDSLLVGRPLSAGESVNASAKETVKAPAHGDA